MSNHEYAIKELQDIISFCDNMSVPVPRSDFERGMNKGFDYVRQYVEGISKSILNSYGKPFCISNTKGGE